MIKEGQKIKVKMSPSTKKWYESLGYNKKMGEEFEIPPEHLPPNSHNKIIAICDFGGEEVEKTYRYYLDNVEKNNGKFKCIDCYRKDKEAQKEKENKIKKTCLEKYGVENPGQSEEVKNKIKETCLERYGVEYVTQTNSFKEKVKNTMNQKYGANTALEVRDFLEKSQQTCKKHYGAENPQQVSKIREKTENTNLKKYGFKSSIQNEEVKQKAKETCLAHYGVEYSLSSEEVRDKGKDTMLKKYGVENAGQSKELQEKAKKTMFKYGKTRTSKQQKEIFDLLSEKYECILNYPVENYNLDCALFIDNIKIDIEYDGWYWHNKYLNKEKDNNRDKIVQENGFKVLRIKGGRSIPNKEELSKKLESLINTDLVYNEIILPEWDENVQ